VIDYIHASINTLCIHDSNVEYSNILLASYRAAVDAFVAYCFSLNHFIVD